MIRNGEGLLKLSITMAFNFAMQVQCGLKFCCLVSVRFSLEIYIRARISLVHHMLLMPAFLQRACFRK
jgi:hypothetical protein